MARKLSAPGVSAILWAGLLGFSPIGNAASTIDVMFFNAFNLFDASHDEGKDDWTFLPANFPGKTERCNQIPEAHYREDCLNTNWTEAHYDLKVAQTAQIIREQASPLPDMIGLCEVENENSVGALARRLGYEDFVVTHSPDARGIDVALIYRPKTGLRYERHQEHVLRFNSVISKPTRNILEVEFKLTGNERLLVFVNHWPSQAAPSAVRFEVAKQLQNLIQERTNEDADVNILVMGDFNTVMGDYPHPFRGVFNEAATKYRIQDVHELFLRSSQVNRNVKNKMPLGTYFYPPPMSWDRLDRFFVNQNLNDTNGYRLREDSYRILHNDSFTKDFVYQNDAYFGVGSVVKQTPFRGNTQTLRPEEAGYSDHFPITVQLIKN